MAGRPPSAQRYVESSTAYFIHWIRSTVKQFQGGLAPYEEVPFNLN